MTSLIRIEGGRPDSRGVDIEAPRGLTWVCAACGRVCGTRHGFRDSACVQHAVLCRVSPTGGWDAYTGSVTVDGSEAF